MNEFLERVAGIVRGFLDNAGMGGFTTEVFTSPPASLENPGCCDGVHIRNGDVVEATILVHLMGKTMCCSVGVPIKSGFANHTAPLLDLLP
jgi:hypothetical protein